MSLPDAGNNPYQPPRAPVADVEDPRREDRPRLINVAVWLIVISVLAGFANTAFVMKNYLTAGQFGFFLVAVAFMASISAWITYKIWQGRNWARILLLIMVLAGLAMSVRQFPVMLQMSLVFTSVFVARSVLLLAALGIVFLSPARRWFSRRRE